MEARALELNGKQRFAAAFDTVGGQMKKLCLQVVDFYGHVATILPEPKGFDCDLWTRGESIAFNKCLSIHFIFLGSAARSSSEKDWKVYQVQLKALMQLIERGQLPAPKVEVIGKLSVETVRAAHLKLTNKHTRGKLVMVV
jgi:NADPH:quinone reductase-like Zn-dependent oxidoreductase